MGGTVQVKHEVTMTIYGTATVTDLATFMAEVERAGMKNAVLTWSAHPGDQREPNSLTITARPGR